MVRDLLSLPPPPPPFPPSLVDFSPPNERNLPSSSSAIPSIVEAYVDAADPRQCRWKDFVEDVSKAEVIKDLENAPTADVMSMTTSILAEGNKDDHEGLSAEEEATIEEVLSMQRMLVKNRGILINIFFENFDMHKNRYVSKPQFKRALKMAYAGFNFGTDPLNDIAYDLLTRKFYNTYRKLVNYGDYLKAVDMNYTRKEAVPVETSTIQPLASKAKKGSMSVDSIVQDLRELYVSQRTDFKGFFEDYDPLRHG